MLWRIIFAVIGIIFARLLLVPLADFLGFPLNGSALQIIQICIVGIAVYYVLAGWQNPPWRRAG